MKQNIAAPEQAMETFDCIEKGCAGKVNPAKPTTTLKTGCCSSGEAVSCPVCGRMYWKENGVPVESRSFEKVFLLDGNMVNKPMNSSERALAIDDLLHSAKKGELIEEYYKGQFEFLIGLGHATDCPALDTLGECACGNSLAEKWIRDHTTKK